jgi:outer membrane protein assembly factor BamB
MIVAPIYLLDRLKHMITSANSQRNLTFRKIGIIAIIASVIIGGATVAYSAYPLFLRVIGQPPNGNNSPSILRAPPTTTSSKISIILSNRSDGNNNNSLFRNQSDLEDWLTYHHDFFRTGFDSYKPVSYSNSSIHENWTSNLLDGAIYAEPLVAKNMVFVATENNTIYSLETATGKLIWRTNLGAPVPLSDLPCGNIDPTGITGTPVVDLRTRTIFAVAFLSNTHRHELFGLDIGTGKIRFQADVDPPNSDPLVQQQRGALALSYYNDSTSNATEDVRAGRERGGGIIVYVPFGGLYGDCGQYHGWMVGAPLPYASLGSDNKSSNISNSNASSIGNEAMEQGQLPLLSFQVPTNRKGGIWAPSGPAIDPNGNILVATGDGDSRGNFDFGNSVIKLPPELGKVVDWFAPNNWAALNDDDTDLGSTGPAILNNNIGDNSKNDTVSTHTTSIIFQIGKEGMGYLLRGDKLGGINGQIFSAAICDKGAYGGTAYAAPYLYVPCSNGLVALYLQSAGYSNNNNTAIIGGSAPPGTDDSAFVNASKNSIKSDNGSDNGSDDPPNNNSSTTYSSFIVKWRGPSFRAGPPIVADGLVWTLNINKGILYAFDQSTGNKVFQQDLGSTVHFSTASSSRGKIFVAASDKIISFSTS